MTQIQILGVIACTATALTPVGVCGDDRPDTPPIKIVGRLFNHKDEVKLGLSAVKA